MAEDIDIRWGLSQRFDFIEWRAFWWGKINRRDLELRFQISTPQASNDFRRYLEAAPGNIDYDPSDKCYVALPGFSPRFLRLSPERYLLQLKAIGTKAVLKSDTWFDQLPPFAAVPEINRDPSAHALREVLRAIEFGRSISVNYRSMSSSEVRSICPHALAHDGHRWHVRALSLQRGEFRDYVLGRILSVGQLEDCDANPADDLEWNTEVDLDLIAHPGLNPQQRSAIEQDFQFRDGRLVMRMRLALAFYFIKRNNLDLRDGQIAPERVQLFIQNFAEVESAAAKAKDESRNLIAHRLGRPTA